MDQDLPRLGQEHRPGYRQRDVVGAAFRQPDAQLTLEPLHLLAQRRLHDVLPGGRPAEVQFLGQGHEIAKLTQLYARRHPLPPFARNGPWQWSPLSHTSGRV